jgi:large subunit ribosomal protein L29
MALLRMKDLRALTDEELARRIGEIENDLLRERGVAAMGGAPPSPGRMRALRTNVARALTVLNERRIAAAARPAPAPKAAPSARRARAA